MTVFAQITGFCVRKNELCCEDGVIDVLAFKVGTSEHGEVGVKDSAGCA